MPDRRAAGFVLVRSEGEDYRYLLLRNRRRGEDGLAKGHADGDESDLDTALRETEEETGLAAPGLMRFDGFRRPIRYEVKKGTKEVTYFLARTETADIRLSDEHDAFDWVPLLEALRRLPHENLQRVVYAAAAFLRDPSLRRTMGPAAAEMLLSDEIGDRSDLVEHCALVAETARRLASASRDADADFVESAALLHDVGRSRTHGVEHAAAGFEILLENGHGAYTPVCVTHFTKGATAETLETEGIPAEATAGLSATCDLSVFPWEEKLVALADGMCAGSRRVSPEERADDLERRYGASPFLAGFRRRMAALRSEFEERTGFDLEQAATG